MKSIEGVFIQANEEQMAAIWNAVALHGFSHDSKGVLDLLMLATEPDDEPEDEPPDTMQIIADHLAQNPAQAEALRQAGSRLFSSVLNRFKKPL
jgi:hypothetical protein